MTNNMIPPVSISNADPIKGTTADDEDTLESNNPKLDDGETTDSQDTVDNDVREAAESAKRLDE